MTRLRMVALAALTVFAVSLGAASTASAQDTAVPATKKVALTGTKGFKGTFTINRFANKGGEMVAIGKLSGTVRKNGKTKRFKSRTVTIPAALAGGATTAKASQDPLPDLPPGRSCSVLALDLGPINLNLLGLVVRTNEIQLRIDAVPGRGNLLGNLLCAITGILNPGGGLGQLTGALNDLVAALNAILALLPQGPATAATAAAGR